MIIFRDEADLIIYALHMANTRSIPRGMITGPGFRAAVARVRERIGEDEPGIVRDYLKLVRALTNDNLIAEDK